MRVIRKDWGEETESQPTVPPAQRRYVPIVATLPPTIYGIALHPSSEVSLVRFPNSPDLPPLEHGAPYVFPGRGIDSGRFQAMEPAGYGGGKLVLCFATDPDEVSALLAYVAPRSIGRNVETTVIRTVAGGPTAYHTRVRMDVPRSAGRPGWLGVGGGIAAGTIAFGWPTVPPPGTTYAYSVDGYVRHRNGWTSYGASLTTGAAVPAGSAVSFGPFFVPPQVEALELVMGVDAVAAPTADMDPVAVWWAVPVR